MASAPAAEEEKRLQSAPTIRASRRRGRTPSELLARKQQLLAGSLSPGAANSLFEAAELQQEAPKGAEQKLESLSALVREKQEESSADEQLDNVYVLLAKKEKDLHLAAELGKVLLERNDELSKANERITEEYSHKLELLEQEKHKLKRKLDLLDGEYENRLIELQTDCNILKNQLDQKDQSSRQLERERAKLIDDLVQQNQRLTRELAEATKSEELLSSQLEQVNERMNARLSNRLDHVAQVDALQDEVQILNQRKQDLERRLKVAQSDKLNLSATIEESSDKIIVLENLLNERESKLSELITEVNELRDSSSWLAAKLESMISLNERVVNSTKRISQQHMNADSCLNEENLDDLAALSERERSQLIEQLKELRLKTSSRIKASNELLLMSQRRSNLSSAPSKRRQRSMGSIGEREEEEESCSSTSFESRGDADRAQFSQELINEIYHLLQRLQINLQQRKEQLLQQQQQQHLQTNSSPLTQQNGGAGQNIEDSGILTDAISSSGDSSAPAKAPDDASEWRQVVASLRALIEEMPCSSCQLMISERADFEQLQKRHAKLCDELRVKNDQLLALEGAKIEHTTQLNALEERLQTLTRDLENCDTKSKEEIVRLAWQARDDAVSRKNAAEIALAKTRVENMQISSQLMEVVQQKGQLSQKLAQFEDDIHYMMQRSVRNKFTLEELKAEEKLRRRSRQRNYNETSTTTTVISNFGQSSIMQISQLLNSIGAPKEPPSDTIDSNEFGHIDYNTNSALQQSPTSATRTLFANIKANKFNLKFWQPKQVETAANDARASDEAMATQPPVHQVGGLSNSVVAK